MLMKCRTYLYAVALLVMTGFHSGYAVPVGLWEFENPGALNAATIGSDLALTGTDAAAAGSGTPSDSGAAQLDIGSYYTVTHGITANGGGAYVNEFTMLWDIMYPQATAASWKTLLQTSVANANDGDLFIRPSDPQGAIGVGDTGYSTNTTSADSWYRVVLSVANGSHFKVYVDGTEWLASAGQPVDGRFSLDPVFHILADNDGDDALMNVSNFAIWGTALDANAIAALGRAGGALSIPEPASVALMMLCAVGAACRRRG
jgi:hypothetical protein